MSVYLVATHKRFTGLSTDNRPFTGVHPDGTTTPNYDVPVGSEFFETDTGKTYKWSGFDWKEEDDKDVVVGLLGELLAEMRAVRSGMELDLFLTHGHRVDLRTEEVLPLDESVI